VRTSDVVANQFEHVAKDAIHQLGGYRGNLLLVLLAANHWPVTFQRLSIASASRHQQAKLGINLYSFQVLQLSVMHNMSVIVSRQRLSTSNDVIDCLNNIVL